MDNKLSETLSYDKLKEKMDTLQESLDNEAMGALGKITLDIFPGHSFIYESCEISRTSISVE